MSVPVTLRPWDGGACPTQKTRPFATCVTTPQSVVLCQRVLTKTTVESNMIVVVFRVFITFVRVALTCGIESVSVMVHGCAPVFATSQNFGDASSVRRGRTTEIRRGSGPRGAGRDGTARAGAVRSRTLPAAKTGCCSACCRRHVTSSASVDQCDQ